MSKIIHLSIPGMKCNGCVTAIEQALSKETGIIRRQVDLDTKRARIETDTPLAELVAAIRAAGFNATELPEDYQESLA